MDTERAYDCRGKRRFKQYQAAKQEAEVWATRKRQPVVLPWECHGCGAWHIGPRPRRPNAGLPPQHRPRRPAAV